MNPQPTRKPAFLERLLTARPLWAVVVATALLTNATLLAQVRPLPDTNPVTLLPQAEQPPTRPVDPALTEPVPSAASGLEGRSLQLDYPTLEIAEDRAYIHLFFTILGDYRGTNDIAVRARFVSGTATPGQDFGTNQPVRIVPAVGGLGSMNWLPLPTILDEINEVTRDMPVGERTAKMAKAFGLLGITSANVLSQTVGGVVELADRLKVVEGVAAKTAKAMDSGLGGSMRLARSAVNDTAIELGSALAPSLQTALAFVPSRRSELPKTSLRCERQSWQEVLAALTMQAAV